MNRTRVRVRFAKEGDLRMIGHRDLVRALERLFRRCGVELAMSQGFHPRPLMTFPDALAVGIVAQREVMDITLLGEVDEGALEATMNEKAPSGLSILEVRKLGDQDRKAKLKSAHYAFALPDGAAVASLQDQIDRLRLQPKLPVNRRGKELELDLQASLERLWVEGPHLKMDIRIVEQSQLQPRDILAALGLHDAYREGAILTRTHVELTS